MTQTKTGNGTITVSVNGEQHEVPASLSVAELLRSHELDARMVVVEHNRVILRDRDAFSTTMLKAGDSLEIVHFVGGG